MIIIFIGPPFAGKETQSIRLSEKLNIPYFSMGHLIRSAYQNGNPKAIEGFNNYYLKGKHLPNNLKFDLLKEEMDHAKKGFILDNYPANAEDLKVLLNYLTGYKLKISKVFLISISKQVMENRLKDRGRMDDDPEIVSFRRDTQDIERQPVIEYFKNKGLLVEIDGEKSVDDVSKDILNNLN